MRSECWNCGYCFLFFWLLLEFDLSGLMEEEEDIWERREGLEGGLVDTENPERAVESDTASAGTPFGTGAGAGAVGGVGGDELDLLEEERGSSGSAKTHPFRNASARALARLVNASLRLSDLEVVEDASSES
mmetsp:Transcript_14077/g.18792  ORF Transcript_14077/g.18792 Transcript_14077/m.18792 type:complete len:132 (+) Transcript_14077:270-665(+)